MTTSISRKKISTLLEILPLMEQALLDVSEAEKDITMLGEKVYTAYYDRVHRYMSFRLFDKSEADDLAQTVFLKIFVAIEKGLWEGAGDIRYIFTVARNTLIDHFRRTKHASIISDEIVDMMPDTGTSSDSAEQKEQHALILSAMTNLRADEHEAVSLRFLSDMEYPAIAKQMEKREDAVRQLVHRGLKTLKADIKPLLILHGYC